MAPAHQVEVAKAFARSQAAEQGAKLAAFDQQIGQKQAEFDEVQAGIDKLQGSLPLLKEKSSIRTKLLAMEYGNRFAWLDAEQALREAQHDLIVQGKHAIELEAARSALERQQEQTRAEYAHKILSNDADAEQKASQAEQDLIKAQKKSTETELRSPIDGVVQQLAVHTLGGIVTPAQQLLAVVPKIKPSFWKLSVANADVGFIRPGQQVEIKIETFNFTRYGLVHGRVIERQRGRGYGG